MVMLLLKDFWNLKVEYITKQFAARVQASSTIFEFIEFWYNFQLLHLFFDKTLLSLKANHNIDRVYFFGEKSERTLLKKMFSE